MNSLQQTAQAFASITIALDRIKGYKAKVPIKLINGSKSISIPAMEIDTGATETFIPAKYATALGLNLKRGAAGVVTGVVDRCNSYTHVLDLQVGTLKPLSRVNVTFLELPCMQFLLGWRGVLERAKIEVYGGLGTPKLTYSELAQSAMANAQAYFRSRI
jgi:hypothetical protein